MARLATLASPQKAATELEFEPPVFFTSRVGCSLLSAREVNDQWLFWKSACRISYHPGPPQDVGKVDAATFKQLVGTRLHPRKR